MKLPAYIRIRELSKKLGIDQDRIEKYAREEGLRFRKASEIILDFPRAAKFVESFNIKPEYEEIDAVRSDYWDMAKKHAEHPTRPSVIAVMGEIDHGKTSLLDALSNSNVADFEPGKITQSLSAFTVDLDPSKTLEQASELHSASRVTFLDTPGHGAFENMRVSGASVSDFILLVISAVDGVTAATARIAEMALKYWVPIVVAINKIDIASEDQIKAVYKALRLLGKSKIRRSKNPVLQGKYEDILDPIDDQHPVVAIVEISATQRTNMDALKRVLKVLHSSMEDNLHVDPNTDPAEATVIESYSTPGLGRVLLLISHLGTLSVGSPFVTNNCSGIIKSLRLADSRYLSSSAQEEPSNRRPSNRAALAERKLSTSKEILEGSVGNTVDLQTVGAGLPVLISGLKQDHFVPAGAAFFQFASKARVDEVMDFRETLMEYRMREQNGSLLLPTRQRKAEDGDDDLDEETDARPYNPFEDNDDLPDERKNNLSVVMKADNQGRLDAMLMSAKEVVASLGFELKLLVQGIGDVTTHDLSIAQVEFEENHVPRIPFFLFNTGFDANAEQWLKRHSNSASAFQINSHDVFLNILKDLKQEIRLKKERQAALPPLKRPSRPEPTDQPSTSPRKGTSRTDPKSVRGARTPHRSRR